MGRWTWSRFYSRGFLNYGCNQVYTNSRGPFRQYRLCSYSPSVWLKTSHRYMVVSKVNWSIETNSIVAFPQSCLCRRAHVAFRDREIRNVIDMSIWRLMNTSSPWMLIRYVFIRCMRWVDVDAILNCYLRPSQQTGRILIGRFQRYHCLRWNQADERGWVMIQGPWILHFAPSLQGLRINPSSSPIVLSRNTLNRRWHVPQEKNCSRWGRINF